MSLKKGDKVYMCTKTISVCLGISWLVILLLSINIFTRDPVCERRHLDEIDKSKDVISSEEMAKKIVEIYERNCEEYKNYESAKAQYAVNVIYFEQQYEWVVQFQAIVPEGQFILDGFYDVGVRRDTGMLSQIPR